jgi:Family of unknown function (DUF5989)
MKFFSVAKRRVGIVGELLSSFSVGKRWWVLPILIFLFIAGALILVAQSSAIAPFIYTLF